MQGTEPSLNGVEIPGRFNTYKVVPATLNFAQFYPSISYTKIYTSIDYLPYCESKAVEPFSTESAKLVGALVKSRLSL